MKSIIQLNCFIFTCLFLLFAIGRFLVREKEKNAMFPFTGFRHSHQLHQSHDGSAGGEDRWWRGGKNTWDVQKCHLSEWFVFLELNDVTWRSTGP